MNYNTSQGIPSNQLVSQFIQVYPNQVPSIPNIWLPQHLYQCLPIIVFNLISVIQEHAQSNPSRVILFNWMSQNGFQNPQFAQLVQHACCLFAIDCDRYRNDPLDQTIIGTVRAVTEQYIGRIVDENNYLVNTLDQNQFNQIKNWLNEYQRSLQLVGSLLQQVNNNGQGYRPTMDGRNNGGSRFDQNINRGFQPQQNYGQQQQVFQPPNQQPGGLFVRTNPGDMFGGHVNLSGESTTKSSDRYSSSNRISVEVPVEKNTVAAPVTHREVLKKVMAKEWAPTADAPFVFITNSDQGIVVSETEDGNVKLLLKDKNEMNRNEHFIKAEPINIAENVINFGNSTERVSSVKEELKAPEEIKLEIGGAKKQVILDTCINNAIVTADVFLRTMKKKDSNVNIFHVNGILFDPVISDADSDKLAEIIAVQTTFNQLCASLKHIKTQIENGKCEIADEISFNFFNRRLTNSLNNFIKKRLCLTRGWIDSFIDDVPENKDFPGILQWMKEKVGVKYSDLLESHQHEIILDAVDVIRDDAKRELDNDYIGEIEESIRPFASYAVNEYTLTTVEIFSTDLKLSIPKPKKENVGVAVFKKSTDLFFDIISTAHEHSKSFGGSRTKCFVKTLDGVLIEVHESLFEQAALTVYVHPSIY